MESIIAEILDKMRAGQALESKDLLRILNNHNKLLAPGAHHYSKKKLLPFYLRTKERNPQLWQSWEVTPELEQRLVALLQVKPRRSASGVATITVITKPWKCSGTCIYCPNDLRMPKSYLSDEPACQRAERNYFDPYLQVASRLRALKQMGHVTEKVELIVLGGTWSDYPREYQLWFISELFRALNHAGIPAEPSSVASVTQPLPNPSAVQPTQPLPNSSTALPVTALPSYSELKVDVEARKRRRWYKEQGLSHNREDLIAFTQEAQEAVYAGTISYNKAMVSLYETGKPWEDLARAQRATMQDVLHEQALNEQAKHRVVGLVVETRPNLVTPENLMFLRMLGVTKLQMGIQTLDEEVSTINKRSITRKQIDTALDLTRLYGFKTHTHFMVNLLGATPESDRLDFKRFVTETPYQPDEIKLYPCALVQGTALCKEYEVGNWQPYNEETLVNILVDDVLETPAFTRISRMIRDFSAHDIVAGNKKVNLRQLVEEKAQTRLEQGARIEEIRYREISTQDVEVDELHLDIVPYETISTNEYFLQWVTPTNKIAGFLRLSLPKPQAFETYANQLQVFPDEAMIREVHVYGRAAGLHKQGTSAQHRGLGKKLIEEACALAKREGYKKINVISAVGVRAYYRRLGFVDGTLYQQRAL